MEGQKLYGTQHGSVKPGQTEIMIFGPTTECVDNAANLGSLQNLQNQLSNLILDPNLPIIYYVPLNCTFIWPLFLTVYKSGAIQKVQI